jgi:hypothetical protein
MKKSLFVASLVAAALLMPGTKAQAQFGIGFESPIDMNFGVFDNANGNGADYNDATDITRIVFSGLAASNHTSSTGTGANNGDAVRTVAGVVAGTYFTGDPNSGYTAIPFVGLSTSGVGAPSALELTATIDATGVMVNVVNNNQFEVFLTDATVNFYVDNIDPAATGAGNFDTNDASTWNDGTLVASWSLVNGTGLITFLGSGVSGSTELGATLDSAPVAGFLEAAISDIIGNLQMFVTTDDEPIVPIPGLLPNNIDGTFAGFSAGWGTAGDVDVRAAIDGSSTFNAVPEPSSFVLLSLGGVALVGVAARRRRNAKKAA